MSKKSVWGYGLLILLVACAAAGIWQQNTIMMWYRTWKLQSANIESLSGYVRIFETQGLTGTESLIGCFSSNSETGSRNAGQVLSQILKAWPANDSRQIKVLQQLADLAPSYSSFGLGECLSILEEFAQREIAIPELHKSLAAVIFCNTANSRGSLQLYHVVMQVLRNVEQVDELLFKQVKTLVIVGIKSDQEAIKLAAIQLAVLPGLQLHEHLGTLLTSPTPDPSPEVRQLVLLALGEHEKLLATDDLCRFLNDGDNEVRKIAERVLQVRGLSQMQIKLAKLMHDENIVNRAELPGLVMSTAEIDTVPWMERLSRDPSPAVRAAVARAMGTSSDQRMQSLLKTLSTQDQDASVNQIARYYLRLEVMKPK